MDRTFSSAKVKPRPARTRLLYLMVGQRTTGLSLSTGRGATFAAFSWRLVRRRVLRPGWEEMSGHDFEVHYRRHCSQHSECERGITWSKCTRTRRCQSLRKSATRQYFFNEHGESGELRELTVVLYLLIVLDRLHLIVSIGLNSVEAALVLPS